MRSRPGPAIVCPGSRPGLASPSFISRNIINIKLMQNSLVAGLPVMYTRSEWTTFNILTTSHNYYVFCGGRLCDFFYLSMVEISAEKLMKLKETDRRSERALTTLDDSSPSIIV